jgi:hypothetical protein
MLLLDAGDRHVDDLSAVVGEDDEDEEQPECNRRDDEEVGRHDPARVIGEKGAPGLRRRPSLSLHVLGDGGLTHRDSQFEEFAINPGCGSRADAKRAWFSGGRCEWPSASRAMSAKAMSTASDRSA